MVEAADGGTLFLDEIGEMDLVLQAKLLKLLEDRSIRRIGAVKERKVDLRVISATNCNLEQMVQQGKFRRDLFFRLRIIAIKVPRLYAVARTSCYWQGISWPTMAGVTASRICGFPPRPRA
ncbi:sigma-54 dependent trancsriptional regulator [Pseudomonas putida]|nr:sigma-54 dependent trancsriptional regulator [Pseudomonas putida]